MSNASLWLDRLLESLDARNIAEATDQERERARTRAAICLGIVATLAIDWLTGRPLNPEQWFLVAFALTYGVTSLAFSYFARLGTHAVLVVLVATLVLDPGLLIVVLAFDPERFAFLHPFLLFVIVRSGIRYGLPSMNLSWVTALLSTPLLLIGSFWKENLELAISFLLLLAIVPFFFSPLIKRVHSTRRVEEERARVAAMHEALIARSAFLAKVSHELRSPLQSIVSAIDVLEMRHGSAVAADADLISRIRRSSLLLNTQLRDLLTIAHGEVGRLEMHPEPFEACSLVEALCESARELAAAKNLEVVVDLPADPVFVVADGSRIDQVITNLVVNSIRYTEVGRVHVSLRYDSESRRLHVRVADSGPGIPDSALSTLFSPDSLLTGGQRGESSGLGLAIVGTLVTHLGGGVYVSSRPDGGTEFKLEIPAEPVSDDRPELPSDESTGRILVIDDREDVLEGLVSVIDELGFNCDRASTSAVGANLLAARQYDAVLIDLDMPGKSGLELAQEARRGKGPNRNSRFIAISAGGETMDAGGPFDGRLAKPIDQSALRRALFGVVHESRPSQPGLWAETESPR